MPRTYTEAEVVEIVGLTKEYEQICSSYSQENGVHRYTLERIDGLRRKMARFSGAFCSNELEYLKKIRGDLERALNEGAIF